MSLVVRHLIPSFPLQDSCYLTDWKPKNTMDNLDFTEEEIQRQLAVMGYRNIPVHKVHEVKQG